jgi:hypothetical protein
VIADLVEHALRDQARHRGPGIRPRLGFDRLLDVAVPSAALHHPASPSWQLFTVSACRPVRQNAFTVRTCDYCG